MSDPFIGQINMFGFNFPPQNWANCRGQLLQVAQYQALFSLVSDFYGGDARTTFGLPDLQGRLPMGQGNGPGLTDRIIGQRFGMEYTSEMPHHTHQLMASTATSDLTQEPATGWAPAAAGTSGRPPLAVNMYAAGGGTVPSEQTTPAGNANSVSLLNPAQVLNFSIALTGLYPSRN